MNTNLISICGAEIAPKEYNNQRVVTFKDIDQVHGRPDGTARKRFNDNKKYFKIGEDYFVRKTDEALIEFGITAPNGLVILSESGYLMLVKSFTDDKAWEVQRNLINSYFRAKEISSDLAALSPQLQVMIYLELRQNEQEQKIAALEASTARQEQKMEKVVEIFSVPSLDRDLWQQEMNRYISGLCESYGLYRSGRVRAQGTLLS